MLDLRTSQWTLEIENAFRSQILALARQATAATPLWLVAPPTLLEWYKRSLAASTPTAFVHLLSWDHLRETLEELLLLPSGATVSPLMLQEAISTCLRAMGAEGKLEQGLRHSFERDPIGVSGALMGPIRLILEWVEPDAVPPQASPYITAKLGMLFELRNRIEIELQAQGTVLSAQRWAMVLDALRATPAVGLPMAIAFDGFDALDNWQQKLIDQLGQLSIPIHASPWVIASTAVPDETSVLHGIAEVLHARDLREEALRALEWVRRWVQEGLPLSQLAIVVPSGSGYEEALAGTLAAAGLPVKARWSTPLAATPEIQLLRAFVRIARHGPDPVDLACLLSALPGWEDSTAWCFLSALYEAPPRHWAEVLDAAKSLDPALTELLAELSTLPTPLRAEHLAPFWSRWGHCLRPGFRAISEEALAAYPAFAQREATGPELLLAVERLGSPLENVFSPEGEAVTLVPAGPYLPFPAAKTLVMGFDTANYPHGVESLPLLGRLEIDALRQVSTAGLPDAGAQAEIHMRHVLRLLASSPETAVSYSDRAADGSSRQPSLVLERYPAPPAPPRRNDWLSKHEWKRHAARSLAKGRLDPTLVAMRDAGEAAWSWVPIGGVPVGALPPELGVPLLRHRLSPSSMDTLLQCSFHFYCRYLLRLKERPPARLAEMDDAVRGSLGHRVLELMLNRTQDRLLDPADVLPTLTEVLAEPEYAGLEPARWRFELDQLRRALEDFVVGYAEMSDKLQAVGGQSEWRFGNGPDPVLFPLDDDPTFAELHRAIGKHIPVTGSIDRIVFRQDQPIAIDFKSGNVRKYAKQHAMGLGAQVAVYAWAMEQAGHGAPEAFAYVSLRNGDATAIASKDARSQVRRLLNASTAETLEDHFAGFRRKLTEGLAKVAGGSIMPVAQDQAWALQKAGAHPCRYCVQAAICRDKKQVATW